MATNEEIMKQLSGAGTNSDSAAATVTPPPVQDEEDEDEQPAFNFGQAQAKLTVYNKDPAYHYHWFNDVAGRLELARAAGYNFVEKGEVMLHSGVIERDSDLTSRVSTVVGTADNGDGLRAYLMKIKKEWYEKSQAMLQQRVDAVDNAIRQGKTTGQEDKNFYVPKGSPIRMNTKLEN